MKFRTLICKDLRDHTFCTDELTETWRHEGTLPRLCSMMVALLQLHSGVLNLSRAHFSVYCFRRPRQRARKKRQRQKEGAFSMDWSLL